MKTPRRSITFFSFFPAVALLATPFMFSTLAPASSQNFATEIDSSEWNIPQSQLVLEEFLRAQEVKNGEIEEVKFLDYGDSIYGGGENASSLISSSPAILDSGEVETAYVLQNPEFQRQVEEVKAQAEKAGTAMPPLLTLVALFAFAVATGTSSLKDFVKFSTYTEKVKKTIQVTKKVAKTVYKTITETVARKVKTVKRVAYTAYETVKNVAYNTRTWVETVVRHEPVPVHPVDKMKKTAHLIKGIFAKHSATLSQADPYFRKNERYILQSLWSDRDLDSLKKDFDDVQSGRKGGRFAQNVHNTYNRESADMGNLAYGILKTLEGANPKVYAKVKKEYDESIAPIRTYTEQITHSETTPVVTFTQKPYTAYRDEVETKTVYEDITREVPETIYEDVTEDREITKDVTKYSFTPINEKIDLAMSYLKNYSRILQNPSNRNFLDNVLVPNRDLPLFAGTYDVYRQLGVELKNANIYNMDRTDPKEVEKLLKRHNEFVYSMKSKLAEIEKGKTPEDQMEILFGKTYTDSIRESENAIASAEAEEKAISARFEEIGEMERTNKISTGYARSLYNTAKKNRDQLYRRKRDALKNLKEGKEYYSRRLNGTISSLKNLSFLRSLEDWRRTLDYGERSISSRLVPFTTASGSTIYRRANATTTTTTQAQPKQTLGEKFIAYMQSQWTALQPMFAEYKKQYLEWVAENVAKQSKWSIGTAVSFMDGFLDGVWGEIKTIVDPSTYAAIAKAIGSIVKTLARIGWETIVNGTEVLEHIASELGEVFGTNIEEMKAAISKAVTAMRNITDKTSAHDAGKITGMVAFNFVPFAGQIKKGKTVGKILKEVDGAVTDGVKKYKTMVTALMELTEFSKKFTQIKNITRVNVSKLIDLSEDARIGKSAGHTKKKHLLVNDADLQQRAKGSYDEAVKSGKKLDEIPPATKFHNEEVMTDAVQAWMKSDVGQEYVGKVMGISKSGQTKLPPSLDFPSIAVGRNIGYGFKTNSNGVTEPLNGLTKVKVVLHPDGEGGFILKTAFPTI